jgi:2-phospho-L-lactate guanylyltransferase
VVVPVKSWRAAKSRLVQVPSEDRKALALALALDTVETVLRTRGVLECLVVGEASTCADLAGSGARLVQHEPDSGVDEAFSTGAAASHRSAQGVCLLVADLPLLDPDDLADVLVRVPPDRPAVVRDRQGTGTVLLAARGRAITPAFGPGSGARHTALGAHDLSEVATAALRTDLDVWDDLAGLRPRPGSRLQAWCRSRPGPRRDQVPVPV